MVSIGVTAKTASIVPAPIPAMKLRDMVSFPCSSANFFLKKAFPPKRNPALGMDPNCTIIRYIYFAGLLFQLTKVIPKPL